MEQDWQTPTLWGGSVVFFVVSYMYYLRKSRITVITHNSPKMAQIVKNCPLLNKKTWNPFIFCTNRHVQTVVPNFVRRKANVKYSREYLRFKDGACIALDWSLVSGAMPESQPAPTVPDEPFLPPPPPTPPRAGEKYIDTEFESTTSAFTDHTSTKPLLVLLHGVSGGSRENYVTYLVQLAHKHNWDAVAINSRGCGGAPLTTAIAYCAASSDDLDLVLQFIHRQRPNSPLYGAGVSLGASVLAKYLGEMGASSLLSGGVSLACPWDCLRCIKRLHRESRLDKALYSGIISIRLMSFLAGHPAVANHPVYKAAKTKKIRDVWDFDEHITAPIFGFSSATEYYSKASAINVAPQVTTPLLAVIAKDDPLAPWYSDYPEHMEYNKNIAFAISEIGGHHGWMGGWLPSISPNWGEKVAMEFLLATQACNDVQGDAENK